MSSPCLLAGWGDLGVSIPLVTTAWSLLVTEIVSGCFSGDVSDFGGSGSINIIYMNQKEIPLLLSKLCKLFKGRDVVLFPFLIESQISKMPDSSKILQGQLYYHLWVN